MSLNHSHLETTGLIQPKNVTEYVCEHCGQVFKSHHSIPVCKPCQENILFAQVRTYIRQNEVTEFEVANYFRIPLRLVKKWIREGRIDYKDYKLSTENGNCRACGATIPFGNYCCDCLKFLPSDSFQSELDFCSELKYEQKTESKSSFTFLP